MIAAEQLVISLEDGCGCSTGLEHCFPLWDQLSRGNYDVCSVMEVPRTLKIWLDQHRTARRRARHSELVGYKAGPVALWKRPDEVYAINTSLEVRQGRKMTEGYWERPSETPIVNDCVRHAVMQYGVVDRNDVLVAYAVILRMGELRLVSQILGHGAHLKNDVMYLLFRQIVKLEAVYSGWFVYNRHDSGGDGLRYFKEKLGFVPMAVRWSL
jgi:hypothetical protein